MPQSRNTCAGQRCQMAAARLQTQISIDERITATVGLQPARRVSSRQAVQPTAPMTPTVRYWGRGTPNRAAKASVATKAAAAWVNRAAVCGLTLIPSRFSIPPKNQPSSTKPRATPRAMHTKPSIASVRRVRPAI